MKVVQSNMIYPFAQYMSQKLSTREMSGMDLERRRNTITFPRTSLTTLWTSMDMLSQYGLHIYPSFNRQKHGNWGSLLWMM